MRASHILRFTAAIVLVFVVVVSTATGANCWSLKTHAWIAQQVLNDALDDGRLELAGRSYPVSPRVISALRNHPERFRMGSLGPDVFPDPIVGQTTVHPGVDGGWQADDWLKHLLVSATTDEELAFAYGYIVHAAGDIFAHTYVNIFAGDIFLLTDGEREAELRHFALEKYIESLTPVPRDLSGSPIDWSRDFGTATSFARDVLIMNGQASKENARAASGIHLTAMYEVRERIRDVDKGTQSLISKLTDWGGKYFEAELKLQTGLTQAGIALDAAKIGLDAAEELLNIKKKVVEAQLAILSKAKDIIVRHPELINGQASLLIQQTKLAAEAVAEAARIANEVDKEIDGIQRRIDGLHGRIASLACYLLVYPPAIRKCRDAVARIAAEIQRLRDDITRAGDRRRFAQEAADAAKRLKDEIKERLDKLKAELDEATRGIAEGTYVAAVEVANAEQRAQEEVVKESQKAVEQAKQFIAELEKKLDELARVTRPIRTALEQLNPITLLIRNWLRDVGIAAEEYIKASHRAGLLMLRSEGNPLKEYTEWYSCYGQVFLAIPKEVGQIGCLSKRYLKEISDAYDRFLGGLPEVLQWLIDPGRKVRRIVEKPVKEALEDAGIKLVGFLTDKRTAEFIELLTHPKTADRNHFAHSGDCDRLFRRIAIKRSGGSRSLWREVSGTAPLGGLADLSVRDSRQDLLLPSLRAGHC